MSTLPTDLDGEQQPSMRMEFEGMERATIDPDDFTGGFGTWSGTSFAAPLFAGALASHIAHDSGSTQPDRNDAIARGWQRSLRS